MTIVSTPSRVPSFLGGTITAPVNPCTHGQPRTASPWAGEAGTVGRAVVVGAGKMGLPLAVQFARHGWDVTAVDVNPDVVAAVNAGHSHVTEEPGLAEGVAEVHAAGRLLATTDAAAAVRQADVAVLIVPVMLDDAHQPDYRSMDSAVASISGGVHRGLTVIFETTLPIGDTRGRFLPRLEAAGGLTGDDDLFVAFSPERLYSGAVFANLATYPKLVGGVGPESTRRAAVFYDSVLDAEIVAMSCAEAAEFSKLADTTYRDVNIALANEFARVADRVGVDVQEVIAAANSQPYSHIHQPGIGVGGHCIPVYPHLLLSRAPDLEVVATSRRTNDGVLSSVIKTIETQLGGLDDAPILVLGLTYRENVKELAYSRALPLIDRLGFHGAEVWAYDPLLSDEEVGRNCARPYHWGDPAPFRAIVTQTGDRLWRAIDFSLFPSLEVLFDGRNSLREVELPAAVRYFGIGVQAATRRRAAASR
ncbi:MAG: nucleotide sugar dehydrogenase [Candidatus Limnocylindrales bacterium]|jgi:nucleotide sugar dehydrogenase